MAISSCCVTWIRRSTTRFGFYFSHGIRQRVLSIGADGDGRIWYENSSELDEETVDFRLAASVECGCLRVWNSINRSKYFQGQTLIVGMTNNDKRHVVKKFNYALCDQSEILQRFTLPVTAVTISNDKQHFAAGLYSLFNRLCIFDRRRRIRRQICINSDADRLPTIRRPQGPDSVSGNRLRKEIPGSDTRHS